MSTPPTAPPLVTEPAEPPAPPGLQRRIRMARLQLVGLVLLLALPVCAVLGLLGPGAGQARAAGAGLELSVQYPERLRHKTSLTLEAALKNTGSQTLPQARLRIAEPYFAHFSRAEFTPLPQRVTDEYFELDLRELAAGETRKLVVHLEADKWGRHPGRVTASAGAEALAVDFSTTVLP